LQHESSTSGVRDLSDVKLVLLGSEFHFCMANYHQLRVVHGFIFHDPIEPNPSQI